MTTPFPLGSILSGWDPDSPNLHPFWEDSHISKAMLEAHLDGSHDAASRRPELRAATLGWLSREVFPSLSPHPARLDIVDLGCGPGLYTAALARLGHRVTGVDFSARSLDWARAEARREGLAIDYRQQNYLDLADETRYDLALMIWCDLGALTRSERTEVLVKIRRSLKPGGVLVFDCWGPGLAAQSPDARTWSWNEAGFWSPRPHLVLEERVNHPGVVARRVVVWEESQGRPRVYYLRDHCFSEDDLCSMARAAGFTGSRVDDKVLPDTADVRFAVFTTGPSTPDGPTRGQPGS